MSKDDVQDMFKFHRRADANGVERIYMFPEAVINNSIIAFSQTSATTTTGHRVRCRRPVFHPSQQRVLRRLHRR